MRRVCQGAERLQDQVRIVSDDLEISFGGLIGLDAALLPITDGADRDLKLLGELLLREAKTAANAPRSRQAAITTRRKARHWRIVWIAKRRRNDLLLGHGATWRDFHQLLAAIRHLAVKLAVALDRSNDGSPLAHVDRPFSPR